MKKTIVKVLVCSWFCYLAPAFSAVKPVTAEKDAQAQMVWPEVSA